MSFVHVEWSAGVCVPSVDETVVSGGGQDLAIRREGEGADRLFGVRRRFARGLKFGGRICQCSSGGFDGGFGFGDAGRLLFLVVLSEGQFRLGNRPGGRGLFFGGFGFSKFLSRRLDFVCCLFAFRFALVARGFGFGAFLGLCGDQRESLVDRGLIRRAGGLESFCIGLRFLERFFRRLQIFRGFHRGGIGRDQRFEETIFGV